MWKESKGEWREIALDQRNVGGEPRHAFVHVVERLQVGELHHDEEGLLEWVSDRGGGCQDLAEAFFDELRHLKGMKGGSLDADSDVTESASRGRVGEKVVREQRMEIEDRVAVESDLVGLAHKKLDRVLVVEDHLRIEMRSSLCLLAEFE